MGIWEELKGGCERKRGGEVYVRLSLWLPLFLAISAVDSPLCHVSTRPWSLTTSGMVGGQWEDVIGEEHPRTRGWQFKGQRLVRGALILPRHQKRVNACQCVSMSVGFAHFSPSLLRNSRCTAVEQQLIGHDDCRSCNPIECLVLITARSRPGPAKSIPLAPL